MTEKKLFKTVYDVAKALDTPAYVVGGYPRDVLLGREPTSVVEEDRVQAALEKDVVEGGEDIKVRTFTKKRDIDFVILGSGLAFAKAFDEALKQSGSLVEFEDFDTARYVMDEFEVEFAGARSESYNPASRKPDVRPATLEEDLSRRDFTVNAMAQKVMATKLGEIVDPYNGQQDLKDGLLRTPLEPNETFSEDPLRMLRAARFASQLGFAIEEKTLQAMHDNRERLSIVSAERIQEEFFKLLGTPQPSIGMTILYQTGLFEQFLPEVPALEGAEEVYGVTHKNNLWHTFQVVDNLATRTNNPLLRFAGLMHDIGKPGTKKFLGGKRGWTFDMHEHLGRKIVRQVGKRLRMSKDDTEYAARLVRWHQQPIQLMDDIVTDSAVRRLVVNLEDDIDDLLKLCRSDITTGNPKKLKRRLKNYDILEAKIIHVIEKDKLRAFQSPVRGEEIMEATNLKAGPTVGKIKKAIEEAILDGVIPNEYDAAKQHFESIKDEYVRQAADWEHRT